MRACRTPKALMLLLVCLCLSFGAARESAANCCVRDEGGGDYDDVEDVESGLHWEMPRAIVRAELHAAGVVPLCPLLDGSWRAWLQRQYGGRSRDSREHEDSIDADAAAEVSLAIEAAHCSAPHDTHRRPGQSSAFSRESPVQLRFD